MFSVVVNLTMGKNKKDKKKGKGAEKTALKTEKKAANKMKKDLEAIGEDDIERILSKIIEDERKALQVKETIIEKPTRRINFTFVPHPDKEELILFGGEFFNGSKTFVYNDLIFYNIPSKKWTVVKAPNGPAPRCGHQMVTTSSRQGQLWLFGGEFTSPSQSQFYHYRDLWVYHIGEKKWEQVTSPGGPSARSGHRMIMAKNKIFVFGGFHDNLRDFKYFNDIYFFDILTYVWKKLDPSGIPPSPRSGCCMSLLPDGKIFIYGGYSKEKIKKDVDKGHVHTDAFILMLDKHDPSGTKYKWMHTKISGISFSPRCGMSISTGSTTKAFCFGGVFDQEDEEDLAGTFYNDLFMLDLEKITWRSVTLSGKQQKEKSKRRKDKGDEVEPDPVGKTAENIKATTISNDGVFKVTVGGACASNEVTSMDVDAPKVFQPSPRINCGLALKHGTLYLYGGMFEDGDITLTFNDFYSLDIGKFEEWKHIISDEKPKEEWVGSDESSDSESEDNDAEMSEESGSD